MNEIKVIDSHSHFLPEPLIDYIRHHGDKLGTEIVSVDGKEMVCHKEGSVYPLFEGFYDIGKKLQDMQQMQIDQTVLSINPGCFYYWVDDSVALETSIICNDWVCDVANQYPDKFAGMATVPMQNIEMSIRELERIKGRNLHAVEIGPVINDEYLDEPRYFPFFEYCAQNDILVFLHPYYVGTKAAYKRYFNTNLVANVHETNLGINALLFGGIFEKLPDLKVLCSHGGGNFPYQFGRLWHGYEVRQEPKVNISRAPGNFLHQLFFDTILFYTPSLQFLVDNFGADHVVLGTDYPYDMGDFYAVENVLKLKLDGEQRKEILGENVYQLIKHS